MTTDLHPRRVGQTRYELTKNTIIDPAATSTPLLTAQLADAWVQVSAEVPGTASDLAIAVRHFVRHLPNQTHGVGDLATLTLRGLRRRHLDSWEAALLAAQDAYNSDAPYTNAVLLMALLRRIEQDNPGTLDDEVATRLERPTRLSHRRFDGVPAFSISETRRLRSAAHRVVHHHRAEQRTEPTPELIVALFVLLSLGTGEPPEVLRRLSINDIQATAVDDDRDLMRGTHSDRLAALSSQNRVNTYAVTYYKARAHHTYDSTYTPADKAAHRALAALISATARLREESGQEALWLLRRPDGTIGQPNWIDKKLSLRRWAESHSVVLSEPIRYLRLRKTVVAREVAQDPAGYLTSNRRHSPQTFFGHYTNSPVLRAKAGRLLVATIQEAFDSATAGPTVITPEAENLLTRGLSTDALDASTGAALISGDLDGPHAACRNPQDSPFATAGQTCNKFTTGSCFACRNALITEKNLPAVLAMAEYADPARAADLKKWAQHWQDIHETITRVILPAFSPEAIDAAKDKTRAVPIALGVRNDIRGLDEPS